MPCRHGVKFGEFCPTCDTLTKGDRAFIARAKAGAESKTKCGTCGSVELNENCGVCASLISLRG